MIIEATNKRTKKPERFDVAGPPEGIEGSDTKAIAQFNSTHGRLYEGAEVIKENPADTDRATVAPLARESAKGN